MKKNLLIILLVTLSTYVFSQIDTISTNIYQKDGNLGIGISNPETKLRIEENVSDGGERSFIRLRNTNSGFKSSVSLSLESYDKNYGATFGMTSDTYGAIPDFDKMGFIATNGNGFSIYSTSDYGALRFYTNMYAGKIVERMRINADGYVGIGTASPSSLLNLKSNIASGRERNLLQLNNQADGSFAYTGILLKTGNSEFESVIQDYSINYSGSANYDFGGFLNISNNSKGLIFHSNSDNGIIKFYTGHDELAGAGIERMRIGANGNIGINQANPSRTLDINGTVKLEPIDYQPASPTEGDIYMDVNDHILKYHNGNEWIFIDDTIHRYDTIQRYDSIFIYDTIQHYDSIFVYDTIYNYDTVYVKSEQKNTTEEIWSKNDSSVYYENGYVGIGTIEPNSRLQVTGGDIYIENIESGIIMKSPNEQCWRGVLDDAGNLTFSQINCPESSTPVTNQFDLGGEVSVYPNPTQKSISVKFDSDINKKIIYEIFDTSGKKLDEGKIRKNNEELDISSFNAGLYIINFNDRAGNLIATKKIIKE